MAKTKQIPCLQYCMHYLSRYPKTEKELKVKLLQKSYSEEEIDKTIQNLIEKNYLDDEQYTDAYIQSEVIKKGKPMLRIKQKLLQKGVEKSIIESVSKEYEDDIENGMKEKINKEIDKLKAKGMEGFDIVQKLIQKGYHFKIIKEVANERKQEQ